MEISNVDSYPSVGYMQGVCPTCKEWEAPITVSELESMKEEYAHHGSSARKLDTSAFYRRETWRECFQCPVCKTRYSVEFSST